MIRALVAFLTFVPALAVGQTAPDLVIVNATVWTGTARAMAHGVAIGGDRIIAIGTAEEIRAMAGPRTRVLDLPGRFITPGFIDNHTHFGQAGALLLGVNLLDVADAAGLVRRVREARDRMPPGAWLVGGDWGAYEAWAQGSTGRDAAAASRPPFNPSRDLIDSITPRTPALLSKWDRSAYLANGAALAAAGAGCDWPGVECAAGRPTGRVTAEAASRVRAAMPPKSMNQKLAEARMALDQLGSFGVTTIHDNTSPEQLEVYQELRRRGELTVRVYARPTLDRVEQLRALGIGPNFGDDLIRIGGLKGFVDGIMGNSSARFYQPYLTSGKLGEWRTMMEPPGNMLRLLLIADSAGWWPQIHAIGDHGIDTLLTLFEEVRRINGPKDNRRWRVIHAQVLRDASVAARMKQLGVIAEVQPYHAIDDMRWMEQRIGARARWAYAFRTLEQAGVPLSFGSDWPGTNAAWYTANPIEGMWAAVTRQTLDGKPEGGWFPEERVSLPTALHAYTTVNAWAEGLENRKGTIMPGQLADLAVWDANPLGRPAEELKNRRVELTVMGGRMVFERTP